MINALCGNKVAYRFTWPGKDEDVICDDCSKWLVQVAIAMGLHLQLIKLTDSDETCPQCRKDEH